jgi:GxxExxY protein
VFESVYEALLVKKLRDAGLNVKVQVALPVIIEGLHFDAGFRIHLIVENKVIVEIKSVENLHEVHHKQLLTYLKLSKLKLGMLVNFNTNDISKSIFRKVNSL